MVSETTQQTTSVFEAIRLRAEAQAMLDRLQQTRAQSERRLAEAGKADPIKTVTGQSALDAAIDSTRSMIREMDALLAQMGEDPQPDEQVEIQAPRVMTTVRRAVLARTTA